MKEAASMGFMLRKHLPTASQFHKRTGTFPPPHWAAGAEASCPHLQTSWQWKGVELYDSDSQIHVWCVFTLIMSVA